MALAPNGRVLATGNDNSVRLWDITDPGRPRSLGPPLAHSDLVKSVAFAPDSRTLASTGHDATVRLWDVTDPSRPRRLGAPLTGHQGEVSAVAFAPDGRTLATSGNTLRLGT